MNARTLFHDLLLACGAIAGASMAVWGIALASPDIHQGFLFTLVILPFVAVLSHLLRRHCYPNTNFWRASVIAPLDPVPAPLGRKLYVALLTGAQAAISLHLAFVILSRTWNAPNPAAPPTSFVYDVLHPWTLAPLAKGQIAAGPGVPPPVIAVSWWVMPAVGIAIFPFIALGWCGTLESKSPQRWLNQPSIMESPQARIWMRLAMLLFWLPLAGLVVGLVACRQNRPTRGWRYRVSQVSLGAAVLVHLFVAGMFVLAMPRPVAVALDVSGTPGLAIQGTCDVDGITHDLAGVVPARFSFTGHRVVYSVSSVAESGEFQVKATIDNKTATPTSSGNPPKQRVRGWARSRWGMPPVPQYYIESAPRAGQPAWKLGPP